MDKKITINKKRQEKILNWIRIIEEKGEFVEINLNSFINDLVDRLPEKPPERRLQKLVQDFTNPLKIIAKIVTEKENQSFSKQEILKIIRNKLKERTND